MIAVAPDLDVEPLGQRVDDRHADAVQTAGDLVAAASPNLPPACSTVSTTSTAGRCSFSMIATGMPRPLSATVTELSGWIVTATVVAVTGQRLVDRVVDDLVDEVVQSARPGRADVHARALADRLEPLEDGDVLGVVACFLLGAPCGAIVIRQRSSDDIETPRYRASSGAPGRRKLVYIRIAQRTPEDRPSAETICLQKRKKSPIGRA